jgi:hypothetical protein
MRNRDNEKLKRHLRNCVMQNSESPDFEEGKNSKNFMGSPLTTVSTLHLYRPDLCNNIRNILYTVYAADRLFPLRIIY